ncbi:MAG TPA: Sir2 family NAD-dependent protein deacetylase [Bacillota bacterium]|nr:Sir2 family NAD-dependent protein deacetylase [Bacillota bacterium]
MELREKFIRAAEAVKSSRAIIITAGAGMGVDSGLPDFRGDRGFWKAYPMYEQLGVNFIEAANPVHFSVDPAFGWGFYGHRANLYRETAPHEGFQLLLRWINRFGLDYFVVTSNVDGHFQKAGFSESKIYEVHGSIHYLQCLTPCCNDIWENGETVPVDHSTMRARHIPKCRHCGRVARPNILMFGDFSWISNRTDRQNAIFMDFLHRHRENAALVVEIGAGTGVPTIRRLSEHLGSRRNITVVRLNPREPQISAPHIPLPCGAMEGLRGIDSLLGD